LKFQHFLNLKFFWGIFFEIISILEVEIGRNGPGILGVNTSTYNGHNPGWKIEKERLSILWIMSVISANCKQGIDFQGARNKIRGN
jgi:hypothetical protein